MTVVLLSLAWLLFLYRCDALHVSSNKSMTALTGAILSPNWPDEYTNNAVTKYTIDVPSGYTITLDFLIFQTEGCCDILHVYDGDSVTPRMNVSGNETGLSIQSANSVLTLVFETDLTNTLSGFFLRYTAFSERTTLRPYLECPNLRTPSSTTSGVIMSSGFPSSYPDLANCTYWLNAPDGKKVTLTFFLLHTEDCCDFVQVYDQEDMGNKLITQLSGFFVGPKNDTYVVSSNSSSMMVFFTSDLTTTYQGFSAEYRYE